MVKRLSGMILIISILLISIVNYCFGETIIMNPSRDELETKIEEVAKRRGIPTVILKSLARVESVFQQYNSDGSVYTGPAGSIGLMQINNRSAGFDTHKLMYDIEYNIEAGATMLLRKWDEAVKSYGNIPHIGDMDPNVLENWYFALWAYNGWHKSNNPNLVPYKFNTYTKKYAYQDLIYMMAEKEYNQVITPIDSKLLEGVGTPSRDITFETPQPMHLGDIVFYEVNDIVKVYATDSLRYRSEPGGNTLGTFESDTTLEILEGPKLNSGYYWYKVINPDTRVTGWVARNWIYKVGEKIIENPDGNKSWAKDYINDLIEKGIVEDKITEFYPDRYITREELCVYISKALNLKKTNLELPFSDWSEIESSYLEDVKATNLAGYVNGYSDETFRPKNNLTREEIAVILSRITGIDDNLERVEYVDNNDLSDWSMNSVMNVYKLGLMRGKGNNVFKPKDNLTKAEASKIISELIKIMNNKKM